MWGIRMKLDIQANELMKETDTPNNIGHLRGASVSKRVLMQNGSHTCMKYDFVLHDSNINVQIKHLSL